MPLEVQLVSPEQLLFEGEADMVVCRTPEGEIAFQPGHISFLGALVTAPVKLDLTDGAYRWLAVHGGFVEVSRDRVVILSDVAETAEHIDVERAQDAKERAETALARDADDADAAAALARANTRLEVAGRA